MSLAPKAYLPTFLLTTDDKMIKAAGKARDVTVRVENPATWLQEVLDGEATWPLNLIHPELIPLEMETRAGEPRQ